LTRSSLFLFLSLCCISSFFSALNLILHFLYLSLCVQFKKSVMKVNGCPSTVEYTVYDTYTNGAEHRPDKFLLMNSQFLKNCIASFCVWTPTLTQQNPLILYGQLREQFIYLCLFIVYLPTLYGNLDNIASNESVIREWWIGKDVEGRGGGLI
jgi:hypothetical protein